MTPSVGPDAIGPRITRIVLGIFYGAAGLAHLMIPEPFVRIVPPFVPWPDAVVLITGLLEVLGAVGLQVPRLRWSAGLMLAIYAFAVWPANVWHAVSGIEIGFLPSSWWYHAPRLALQPLLVWLALHAGGLSARQGP